MRETPTPHRPDTRLARLCRAAAGARRRAASGFRVAGGLPTSARAAGSARRARSVRRYGLSLGLVALASLLAVPVHLVVAPTNLSMLYLAAVVIAALYLGRGPAAVAALAGVLAFDVLFVPPRLTFSVADTEYIVTFVGLFVVGIVVSSLAAEVRDQGRAAQRRENEARTLYAFSRDLATASGLDDILPVIVRHVRAAFDREAAVLLPEDGRLRVAAGGRDMSLGDEELAAATWTLEHAAPSGAGIDDPVPARMQCLPLETARGVLGVLGIGPDESASERAPERRRLLEVFASLAALAIERAQLAEEARRAQVLEATERLQAALLDAVSHDLRTPLVAITGVLTALEDEARSPTDAAVRLDDGARRGLLGVAREEAARLNRLVGELLDMSRIEAGALRVTAVPGDVEEVIGSALGRLGDRLADRPVAVTVPDGVPMVPMDAMLVVQVLANLLDNAAKHSPPGTPVEVRVEATPDGLAIVVADRGPGVPDADLGRIFDKFHRVARPGGPTGTGLGLAICKGIVEAHGGRIDGRNRDGGGLEIVVCLPAAPATGRGGRPPAAGGASPATPTGDEPARTTGWRPGPSGSSVSEDRRS